jgi:antitoxin HigA-1
MGLTAYAPAEYCHVPGICIEGIVAKEVGVSADTALRLGAAFGTTPVFWLNLQLRHEMEIAKG